MANPSAFCTRPPLQTPWQTALAAGLQTMLPWLDHLPGDADIADKLYTAATRLASSAANALQAAAEGADPAATLEQPAALALAEALLAYLNVDIGHVEGALQRGRTRPDTTHFVMGTLRAVAVALKALALAVVSSAQYPLCVHVYIHPHVVRVSRWPTTRAMGMACHAMLQHERLPTTWHQT